MANANMGGGGSGTIDVNPDEITTVFNYLNRILSELEETAIPNIKKLSSLDYYTAGRAMKAMAVYDEANEKIMDLYDHYSRAATLVMDILLTMMEVDQQIAEQIIAKLEV